MLYESKNSDDYLKSITYLNKLKTLYMTNNIKSLYSM